MQVRLGPWATGLRLLVCVRAVWSRRALVWGEWEPGAPRGSGLEAGEGLRKVCCILADIGDTGRAGIWRALA